MIPGRAATRSPHGPLSTNYAEEALLAMAAHEILTEAHKLHSVSRNLEQLAVRHAPMSEALAVLAGTLRQSATMLEVMVEVRLGGAADAGDVEKTSN